MLKITRTTNGEVVFRLVGRMSADNIGEVETLLSAEATGRRIFLDLGDLTLVDQGVVSFLGRCKANGIEIKNSPAYIREWMKQEKN